MSFFKGICYNDKDNGVREEKTLVKRIDRLKQKKERIFQIIQIGSREDFISRLCDAILVTSILLNITVLFLNTFKEVEKKSTDIGKLIGEIEKNYGVDIVIILRDEVIILATDEVRA